MIKARTSHRRTRKGFTLVELLVAAALSTLLLTAGFAVIRSLARTPNGASAGDRGWQLAAARQVCWDLEHAVLMPPPQGNTVVMAGYGALDLATNEVAHVPVIVEYRMQRIGDRDWLVRHQTSLTEDDGSRTRTQLICADVSGIEVAATQLPTKRGAQGKRDRADFDEALPAALHRLRGFDPAPQRVRVSFKFRDTATPPLLVEVSR